jgi:transcriptional regulator
MRDDPSYRTDDEAWVKQLIRDHPWATLVTTSPHGLVASHYPILVDDSADGLVVFGHIGKPDDRILRFGDEEILLIVQGPSAYISSRWYVAEGAVPTWNYLAAHLYGVPEVLTQEDNWHALGDLVDYFESGREDPRPMCGTPADEAYARALLPGTVGFRLRVTRFLAKNKLSQDKPAESVGRVIAGLEAGSAYADPRLVEAMKRAHGVA